MKIPAPPLYTAPVHASSGGHADAEGDTNDALGQANSNDINGSKTNLAYHGYYSYSSHSTSSSSDVISGNGQGHHHQQHQQRQLYPDNNTESQSPHQNHEQVGQAYYEHYRTAQTVLFDPTVTHCDQQQQNTQTQHRVEDDDERYYDQSSYYNQSLEQQSSHHNEELSFHEEQHDESVAAAPLTPSSSIKDKLLPNVFSLAQKLLPTVMKRLNQQERKRLHHVEQYYDDGFSGTCSPLGSPVKSPTATAASASLLNQVSYDDNLKTTGLEESDYTNSTTYQDGTPLLSADGDDVEMMGELATEEDPMQYLPKSAALLVSALQSSAKKSKKRNAMNGNHNVAIAADVVNTMANANFSLENLPSLMDEAAIAIAKSNSDMSAEEFFNTPTRLRRSSNTNMLEMESNEREADKLLESIRKDDLDGSGGRRRKRGGYSRRGSQDSHDASNTASAMAIGGSSTFDDDDGSIGGDMARLTHSIAHLQRDLENVDFSYLDDIYNDGFGGVGTALDGFDDDGESNNGMLARLKLWFSRGMIMEQKLLHTHVNTNPNNNDGDDGDTTSAAASSGRYVDNPVLVWSISLMWAFVVLILMHPKIAELFEGQGDPGQLADIIEWLFG